MSSYRDYVISVFTTDTFQITSGMFGGGAFIGAGYVLLLFAHDVPLFVPIVFIICGVISSIIGSVVLMRLVKDYIYLSHGMSEKDES